MGKIVITTQIDDKTRDARVTNVAYIADPDPLPGPAPTTEYPKVVQVQGAWFRLYAPLAADWEPSSAAKTFGIAPNQPVMDPSRPQGARSPSGYPTYEGRVMFADENFADEAALTRWRGQVAGQGGSGGTPVTIESAQDGDIINLQEAVSRAFRLDVGRRMAFRIEVPEGHFADMLVRAGLGEYGSSKAQYDIALSPNPLEFEGAPARGQADIAVEFSPDKRQLFSPGTWYLNVRLNAAGREGDTNASFIISWYGPHNPGT